MNYWYIAKVQGEYQRKPLRYMRCDDDVCQNHQIYDFVEIPLFMSLFTGNVNEPLYFVKLVEKSVTTEDLKDACGHVMRTGNCTSKGII